MKNYRMYVLRFVAHHKKLQVFHPTNLFGRENALPIDLILGRPRDPVQKDLFGVRGKRT